MSGEVVLELAAAAAGPLDLDTKGLRIDTVVGESGAKIPWELGEEVAILGRRLRLMLPPGTRAVTLRYAASPDAVGLQWLSPAQTEGKRHPFLFSQFQPIHARTMVPLQDSPRARVTYHAEVTVPEPLSAVMSAGPAGVRPGPVPGTRTFLFDMPQPIPPYLLALAVGQLESRDLSPRARVWAEPATVAAAAWEFAGIEEMISKAESLFGPYEWDRYDMLVLPPSFPYGGMENPRMTFLTPTLLAGDRSLVDVVAHELAHSWTGNLVTNANAEHFWLNEGFTVFAERRILEALEGPDMAALHAAVGFEKLRDAFESLASTPELTKLRTKLDGVDPDIAFSVVPYEKGFLFLKTLEAAAGKRAFDALLGKWLHSHRFGAATTDDFLALVEAELPGLLAKVDAKAWIDEPLLPARRWEPQSARLAAVQQAAAGVPTKEETRGWTAIEWALYLEMVPRPSPVAVCEELDARFGLCASKNYEVLVGFLVLACTSGYAAALPRASRVLGEIGRMKYLKPLYRALIGRPETRELARELFARHGKSYHPIAQEVVRRMLA